MKKIFKLLFLYLISTFSIQAQDINVNTKKFVTIIFPNNITNAVIGNEDYIFEYNEETQDNIALLKAAKVNAEDSNIVVKTENGFIFNINVKYNEKITNVIVLHDSMGVSTIGKKGIVTTTKKNSIATENEIDKTSNTLQNSVKENDYIIGNTVINDKDSVINNCSICETIIKSQKNIKRIYNEAFSIKVQVNNVYYFENKLYVILNFQNNSDLDYTLNYIKSYVDTNNDGKSSSTQYLEKYPISIFNSNRIIPGNTERKYIFIYDQFSIDNNKKLTFEINENNGERNIFLKIPNVLINNPKKYKK